MLTSVFPWETTTLNQCATPFFFLFFLQRTAAKSGSLSHTHTHMHAHTELIHPVMRLSEHVQEAWSFLLTKKKKRQMMVFKTLSRSYSGGWLDWESQDDSCVAWRTFSEQPWEERSYHPPSSQAFASRSVLNVIITWSSLFFRSGVLTKSHRTLLSWEDTRLRIFKLLHGDVEQREFTESENFTNANNLREKQQIGEWRDPRGAALSHSLKQRAVGAGMEWEGGDWGGCLNTAWLSHCYIMRRLHVCVCVCAQTNCGWD